MPNLMIRIAVEFARKGPVSEEYITDPGSRGDYAFGLAPFGSPDVKLDNLGDLDMDVAFQFGLTYFLEQQS